MPWNKSFKICAGTSQGKLQIVLRDIQEDLNVLKQWKDSPQLWTENFNIAKSKVYANLAIKSIQSLSIFQQGFSWNIDREKLSIKCIQNNTGSRMVKTFLKKENTDNRAYYEAGIIQTEWTNWSMKQKRAHVSWPTHTWNWYIREVARQKESQVRKDYSVSEPQKWLFKWKK